MNDYIKQLEQQNEELKQKLAVSEVELIDYKEKIQHPFNLLQKQIKKDIDYAWSWQSNIAMSIMESIKKVTHQQANEAAAAFIQKCFEVDITKTKQFQALEKRWKENE